jgi:enolase-phosphatase E1
MRDLDRDAALHCVVTYALWLMKQDRKSPGLKLLQGMIWEGGFADGSLKGEVYPDVPPALARWREAGISIAIYSSGSVLAQRLLFSTTRYGDLTGFIDHYFDTGIGAKREPESYRRIADEMTRPAPELLFLSDIGAELQAAHETRMQAMCCLRDATQNQCAEFEVFRTFEDLQS